MAKAAEPDPPSKAERTRARILEVALELFVEHGYEATTMRRIAEQAGVSLGNAYYYFASKEHLIQGFYQKTHEEHVAACEAVLAKERSLVERVRGVLHKKIDTAEPYHRISGVLFRSAADPESPLSPFSEDSAAVRRDATELLRRAVDGAKTKLPRDLAARLPQLLWLHEMAIVMFWLHDRSKGRRRTRKLIDHTVDLVGRLVALAAFPLLRPLRKHVLRLLEELEADVGG